MESTTTDENINIAGKQSAEILHAERIVEDEKKTEEPSLTAAQIRKFMIQVDFRVLPMLGVIYAVSIIDRINVSLDALPMQPRISLTSPDRLCESARHARRPQPGLRSALQRHPDAVLPVVRPHGRTVELDLDARLASLVAVLPDVRLGRRAVRHGVSAQLAGHGIPPVLARCL